MKTALKAEFRKLFTVRSTYFVSLLILLFVVFFSFYIEGFRQIEAVGPHKFSSVLLGSVGFVSQMGTIICILLIAHEYRYNTISYTLTYSNSRLKTLLAKIAASISFLTVLAAVCGSLAIGLTYLGLKVHDIHIPVQDFNVVQLFGRSIFYCVAYGLTGLLLAALFRNIIASIILLFIGIDTIETLAGLLLKENAVYLPFRALGQIVITPGNQEQIPDFIRGSMSIGKAMLVYGAYLAIGWTVAIILFVRRDAN